MPTSFAASRNIEGVQHVVCHACGTREPVDMTDLLGPGDIDDRLNEASHRHNVTAGHTDDNGEVV